MSMYFHDLEFLACTPSCNIKQMDSRFLERLDLLRIYCGFPLVLNSAYRSPEWDKSKGRSGNSYHTKGLAVDIRCMDSLQRARIVGVALGLGFSVGVYSNFIHVDARSIDFDALRPIYSKQVLFYGL